MKKTLLIIFWLLLSLIMPACSLAPRVTYEQLSLEAELTGDTTKLDKFEAKADKAALFFEHKRLCLLEHKSLWFCPHGMASKRHGRKEPTIEQLIRMHRIEKDARCGCVTNAQMHEVFRFYGRGY